MLSRVAESIYWMSRYIERAENYARFIDVNLNLAMELPHDHTEQWAPLVMTTGDVNLYEKYYRGYSRTDVIRFLTTDVTNPNSILSCLEKARENARTVREMIPQGMWMQINEMYLWVKESVTHNVPQQEAIADFYRQIKLGAQLFHGIRGETYSREDGWHFSNLGSLIERADKTARIIDMKYYYLLPTPEHVGTPLDMLQWSALLNSAGAYEMYRKFYGTLDINKMIDFLMFNRTFPRAILYCLMSADASLRILTGREDLRFSNKAERGMGRLVSRLMYSDASEIFDYGLHEYMDQLQQELNDVANDVHETFFAANEMRM